MTGKRYKVINHLTGHWAQVTAASAQEACQSQGWHTNQCFILETPLPPGRGRDALTKAELQYLKDINQKWNSGLEPAEVEETRRILNKWLDAQEWEADLTILA